jgi:hypothetical protein
MGTAGYFLLVQPKSQLAAKYKAIYDPIAKYTDPVTGPQLLDAAQTSLVNANKQAVVVGAQWSEVLNTKNPRIDYSDRWKAWLQWGTEADYDFAPRLNSFLKHTGVATLTSIAGPSFPSDPNAIPMGLLEFPLPTITVFGSYNQIVNHLASWNRFSRIVVVDNLALQGYSPFMTGTYSATEYVFTRNAGKPGPPVPSAPGLDGAQIPKPNSPSFDQQAGFNGKAP